MADPYAQEDEDGRLRLITSPDPTDRLLQSVGPTLPEKLGRLSGNDYFDPRQRVLVVDDEPDVREIISIMLGMEQHEEEPPHNLQHPGFCVQTAEDGDIALEILDDWTPNLILMDLMMPRMPGIVAIRHLRENPATQAIPVIAMSAGANLKKSRIPEADSLMPKPFDFDNLLITARFWANRRSAWPNVRE